MSSLKTAAIMIAAAFLFACMSLFAKLAGEFYSASEMVFYRSAFGLALMLILARAQGVSMRTKVPRLHIKRNLAGTAALCLWFYSLQGLPLSTAVTLNYMSSVWVAAFLVMLSLFKPLQKADWRLTLAVIAGFVGVALVLGPSLGEGHWLGGLAGLIAGVFSAIAYVQLSSMGSVGEPNTRVVFYFSLAGLIAGTVLATLTGWHPFHLKGMLQMLAMAAFGTVGQLLLTQGFARGPILTVACLQYLGIVFSTFFGVFLFAEPFGPNAALGMALIVGSGVIATVLQQPARAKAAHAA